MTHSSLAQNLVISRECIIVGTPVSFLACLPPDHSVSWNSTRTLLCHFSKGKTHCHARLCKILPFPREASTPYYSLHFWSWKLTHRVLVRVLQNRGLIEILKMIVWLDIVTSCSWFLCRSQETWKIKVFVFLHLYISREMTWSCGEGPVFLKSHHMPTSSLQTEIHYISKETLSEVWGTVPCSSL